jgi:DNA processing protein
MSKPLSQSPNQKKYYLGFSSFHKIGPINLRKLEDYFPDLETAWRAPGRELEQTGLNPKLSQEFVAWRRTFNLTQTAEELIKQGINYTTWHDDDYPMLLKEIAVPPPIIYYRGQLNGQNNNRLAVVGSRRHSAYAEKVITETLPKLVRAGIEIVSGLALGVDTLAHQASLNNQGRTLAVLGSGLFPSNLYPKSNRFLAEKIIQNGGAIISEFSPDTPPYKQNFPQRNRIISGLAQATLVVEAPAKSGSLITASYALEQNREVLAVPGNIFSLLSAGPNNLIKSGAQVVTRAEDILEIFNLNVKNQTTKAPPVNDYRPANPAAALIYELIKQATERAEKITADEIVRQSQLDTATVNSTLSILEISGIAKKTESGYDLN